MFAKKFVRVAFLALAVSAAGFGCAGRPSMIPNSDPALRKYSTEFAADAVKRFPAPDGPVVGELDGRAAIDVMADTVQIANFSSEDWIDIEVWINHGYVVHVPKIEAKTDKPGTRTLNFQMMYNDKGLSFPTDNDKYPVETVEIKKDGKLYSIKKVIP